MVYYVDMKYYSSHVLLIIVGVTIATLMENSVILTKANEVKNEIEGTNQEEELKSAKI